jgi:RNA-directed DNA polymerase
MYGWDSLPWRKLEQGVFRLQTRIYQASRNGDKPLVRSLQKLLLNSRAAKLLAVRRVTQDNTGKHTPGVDGVCSLAGDERLELAARLKVGASADPVRRVYIPKPGTAELRPLGIPTIHDRAVQSLVRLALEPEWEARFEPNSYGFRPGRSCWDAVEAIYKAVCRGDKYVLDADIAKCFDRIDHKALLTKIDAGPAVTRQIRAWLKAGILDGETLFPSTEGTPQGGAISPLLANIALHGMEDEVRRRFPPRQPCVGDEGKRVKIPTPRLIRYADDFVVLHPDREVVEQCQQVVTEWLRPMGLELKPSKTRLCHTRDAVDGRAGFDFLGFTVRQFPAGATRTGCLSNGAPLGFQTLIKPSKTAVQRHVARLREVIDRHRNAPQEALIAALNPIIRGWCNYHSKVVSKKIFSKLGTVVYQMLRAWARRRHPHKSRVWVTSKYWRVNEGRGWQFQPAGKAIRLYRHGETSIVRHVKVQGTRSPFDGDWSYWASRTGHHPDVPPSVAWLMKVQKGKCPRCGLLFKSGDVWEVDHATPRSQGGSDGYGNLQALHKHCHHRKTAAERKGGMDDNPPSS